MKLESVVRFCLKELVFSVRVKWMDGVLQN